MASTWEDLLRIELQATGENATTWGDKTNDNFERLADAIAGHESINIAGSGDYTISQSDSVGATFRKAFLTLTGLLTGSRAIILPGFSKTYYFRNATTGNQTITVKTASGVAATIRSSGITAIVCDGTDCYTPSAVSREGDTMTGALAITSGGLGVSTSVSVGGTLNVGGALTVGGITSIAGKFNALGGAQIVGAVTVAGSMLVSGAATFSSTVTVGSSVVLGNSLVVGGAARFTTTVTVEGKLNSMAGAIVTGAVTVVGSLYVSQGGTFQTNVTVGGALYTGGAIVGNGSISGASITINGLDLARLPSSSSQVGQFVGVAPGTGVSFSLPSGGTWIYYYMQADVASGAVLGSGAGGPTAGGTLILAGVPDAAITGWAYRVT